jgi:5-oxoprolinase (ATP-hydrolysing) subunit A
MMNLDLNCDLGEGEPTARSRALMRSITSANVACGGHAGSVGSMRTCIQLAKKFNVKLGAHPGSWDRGSLGRGDVHITPEELELLLLQQISALEHIARAEKIPLHHIKVHGALYHAVEADEALARSYLNAVKRWWPAAKIYARAGGAVARLAHQAGVTVWEEAFADRAYRDDGTLIRRNDPGAVFMDAKVVARRVQTLIRDGFIETTSGKRLPMAARTICVHSDTPGALALLRAVRGVLRKSA